MMTSTTMSAIANEPWSRRTNTRNTTNRNQYISVARTTSSSSVALGPNTEAQLTLAEKKPLMQDGPRPVRRCFVLQRPAAKFSAARHAAHRAREPPQRTHCRRNVSTKEQCHAFLVSHVLHHRDHRRRARLLRHRQ